jgi:chemotaxis protein histidine kinase CheA
VSDVQVVYQLIIQGEDAQETMDGLTNSAVDAQGAMGDLSAEATSVGDGVDGAMPAVAGLATGLGSMAKTGRTSTKVMSGLAAAVQGVSPAAANALRGMSGLTRAFTAGGAALGSYALALAPVLVAVAAAVLVYRELSKAVEEAEEKMAAAAERATEAAEAHRQFTQGLTDVATQIRLINGEIDQFELNRLQGVKQLEEATKAEMELAREGLSAAQEKADLAKQALEAKTQEYSVAIEEGQRRLAAEEALTGPMQAALNTLADREAAIERTNAAVAHQERLVAGVNARLKEGMADVALLADYQRETAAEVGREADERERAADASKAQAEAQKQQQQAEKQQAEKRSKLEGDAAVLQAVEEEAAAALSAAFDDFEVRLTDALDLPPLTALENLAQLQAELSRLYQEGAVSAEAYASQLTAITAAQKEAKAGEDEGISQESAVDLAASFEEMLSGSLNTFSLNLITGTGTILDGWAVKLDDASMQFSDAGSFMDSGLKGLLKKGAGGLLAMGGKALSAAGGIFGAIKETIGALVSIGSAAMAMKGQLQAARDSGDTETVQAMESAIRQAGSEGSAAVAERISGFFEQLGEGIASLPTLLLVGLPKAILEGSLHIIAAIIRLPIEAAKAIVTLFSIGTWGDFFRDLFGELWGTIWADIKELFDIFGDGSERIQGWRDNRDDRKEEREQERRSSRTTASSSASSARSAQRETEAIATQLLNLLSGRRLPGGMTTAAGGPLRREFAQLKQAGGFGRPDETRGGITINTAVVDPTALPRLSQTIDKAGKTGRYGKVLGG